MVTDRIMTDPEHDLSPEIPMRLLVANKKDIGEAMFASITLTGPEETNSV